MLSDVVAAVPVRPFAVMNAVGLVAFALVGATKAIREEFDLFGVTVVGLATAFAGGATRDVLVGRVPLVLRSFGEISLALLGVALAVCAHIVLDAADEHPATLVADAIGLAAFTTAGAIVATNVGVSGFGVVAVATINAVGGGALADLLLGRQPFVLFDDFYASCAVLGGVAYWLAASIGGSPGPAAALCASVTVCTRLLAVSLDWHLPTAQRLGRHWRRR
ncbi:TRIC cation channel family protein [Halarchaeum salinum]|uniref:TRIC cation channel family protein n=2 Tax=Halarchaeum salinum TaxID=489912 RepID=A0AAV3S8S9_9EURY